MKLALIILALGMGTVLNAASIQGTFTDNTTNELGFYVQRSLDEDEGFETILTLDENDSSFIDPSIEYGTWYFYRIIAFNNLGQTEPSEVAAVLASDPKYDTPPLNPPSGLKLKIIPSQPNSE